MVNGNKVIICIFVIVMMMCLGVKYSYSHGKPSENEIKNIIILLEKHSNSLPMYIKNVKYNTFVITNSFFSTINGRYCVEVNLDIRYEGREGTLADFKPRNYKLINKRYSFVKKYNQWFGYEGWGPGED